MKKEKEIKSYHIYDADKVLDFTRKELVQFLISKNQIKHYSETNRYFRKEVRKDELPELYCTKAGYIYAVIGG